MCLTSRQVAGTARFCPQSQTDVIFVAMDALVRIYEDDLIAKRNVVAMQYPCAFDLSLTNQLIANQNALALRLGFILARQKMRMKLSKSKMTDSIWLGPTPLFCFSESSASWLRPWLPASRVTFHGNL